MRFTESVVHRDAIVLLTRVIDEMERERRVRARHVVTPYRNPFLECDRCNRRAPTWHDPRPGVDGACGCDGEWWNSPCGHVAGVTSHCFTWELGVGCRCVEIGWSSISCDVRLAAWLRGEREGEVTR